MTLFTHILSHISFSTHRQKFKISRWYIFYGQTIEWQNIWSTEVPYKMINIFEEFTVHNRPSIATAFFYFFFEKYVYYTKGILRVIAQLFWKWNTFESHRIWNSHWILLWCVKSFLYEHFFNKFNWDWKIFRIHSRNNFLFSFFFYEDVLFFKYKRNRQGKCLHFTSRMK